MISNGSDLKNNGLIKVVLFLFNCFQLVPNCKLRRRPSGLNMGIFKTWKNRPIRLSEKVIYWNMTVFKKTLKCKDLEWNGHFWSDTIVLHKNYYPSHENMRRRFCQRLVLVCNQYSWLLEKNFFASNQTLGHGVKACIYGDVGSAHVRPSKKIKQDEIEIIKYLWWVYVLIFLVFTKRNNLYILKLAVTPFARNDFLCRALHSFVHKTR